MNIGYKTKKVIGLPDGDTATKSVKSKQPSKNFSGLNNVIDSTPYGNLLRLMTDEQLKELFEEGDVPTNSDFIAIIDSKLNKSDGITREEVIGIFEGYYGADAEVALEWYLQEKSRRENELVRIENENTRIENMANNQSTFDNLSEQFQDKLENMDGIVTDKLVEVDTKLNDKLVEVDTKLTDKLVEVDTKLTDKLVEVDVVVDDYLTNTVKVENDKLKQEVEEVIEDVNTAIASGTVDLEVKMARKNIDGIVFPSLKDRLDADSNKQGDYLGASLYLRHVDTEMEMYKLEKLCNGVLCYVHDNDMYFKYINGTWEEFKTGGGGGGIISVVTLTSISDSNIKIAANQPCVLQYNYQSTGEIGARANYFVNNVLKTVEKIDLGNVSFDITQYLQKGSNEVLVEVTDMYGGKDILTYTIDVVELEISSNFNHTIAHFDSILFNYTVKGNVLKEVHFVVDGVEIGTEVIENAYIQKAYTIPKQSHGGHILEAYITADLGGSVVRSNSVIFELICVEEGNTTPIITSQFRETSVDQYSLISIPYLVYSPSSANSDIQLKINNEVVSNLSVSRDEHRWNLTDYPSGDVVFAIVCGNISKEFNVSVKEVILDIEDEKDGLELFLSSKGRTNNDIDKEVWEYNGIKAQFDNFNWKSNGWVLDDSGINTLRINDGGRVTIPFKPFMTDLKLIGKTIEFEFQVNKVINYNAKTITCFSGDRGFEIDCKTAVFKSNELTVDTLFKENERIRVSFVVEGKGNNRLVYTFVNGIISGLAQYSEDDIFTQANPVDIVIGSDLCEVDLYNIRIYNRGISVNGVLNNYIYDINDVSQKLELINKNNIYDSYGEIMYSKVYNQVPCMTIIGELPAVKGDKKKVKIKYEDKADGTRNFVSSSTTIDIQGTSSQYYPKKNYKIKLDSKYKLRKESIEESTFTIKAD